MSIKHSKGRQMDAFDWFIGDGLILARCRVPASLIQSSMARIFFGEMTRKGLSKKMDTGDEFRILSFDFSFRISFIRLQCTHDLHRALVS